MNHQPADSTPADECPSFSRRALFAAAGLGVLSACGSGRGSRPGATSASGSTPPKSQPSAPVSREQIIARYGGAKPTRWGMDFPGIATRLATSEKVVALTFDACGGPHGSGYNGALIELLRRRRVPATLFINGRWISANPDIFHQLAADPLFQIENHGTRHCPLSVSGQSAYGIAGTRDAGEVFDEVAINHARLTQLLGAPPRFFRAGTGHCDDVAVRIVAELGERVVNFDVNGDAGATFNPAQVEQAVVKTRPGSIVIGHMNRPASGTAQGMAAAIG
ncbi:MAG TPA: polysaccharide deacetylase family protein, partial [Mycobacteriales bacterium]|nr:polysaccharide deacetylase family protein [Mycobacteriales bacterium]